MTEENIGNIFYVGMRFNRCDRRQTRLTLNEDEHYYVHAAVSCMNSVTLLNNSEHNDKHITVYDIIYDIRCEEDGTAH